MRKFGTILIVLLIAYSAAAAEFPATPGPRTVSDYDRVLIPIVGRAESASGLWFTDVWVRNDGSLPSDIFPMAAECVPPGGCPEGQVFLFEAPDLDPHATLESRGGDTVPWPAAPGIIPVGNETPGAILYVHRSTKQYVSIGATTLFFPSDRSKIISFQVPSVPEASFVTGTHSLLNVPIRGSYRCALRIYTMPASPDMTFTVRVFDLGSRRSVPHDEALVASFQMPLLHSVDNLRPCEDCSYPEARYKPDVALAFSLEDLVASKTAEARFEITPSRDDVPYWPLLSLTNNVTGETQLFVLRSNG